MTVSATKSTAAPKRLENRIRNITEFTRSVQSNQPQHQNRAKYVEFYLLPGKSNTKYNQVHTVSATTRSTKKCRIIEYESNNIASNTNSIYLNIRRIRIPVVFDSKFEYYSNSTEYLIRICIRGALDSTLKILHTRPHTPLDRRPTTRRHLQLIPSSLDTSSTFGAVIWAAACSTFYGLMRMGEFTTRDGYSSTITFRSHAKIFTAAGILSRHAHSGPSTF